MITITDTHGHEWTRDNDGLGEQRDSPKGRRWMTRHGGSYPSTVVRLILKEPNGTITRHFECGDYETAHQLAHTLDHVSWPQPGPTCTGQPACSSPPRGKRRRPPS